MFVAVLWIFVVVNVLAAALCLGELWVKSCGRWGLACSIFLSNAAMLAIVAVFGWR